MKTFRVVLIFNVGLTPRKSVMTIDLPEDLMAALRARVLIGQFASIDEALAESARLMLGLSVREENQPIVGPPGQGPLGSMRDAADEMDKIVEEAMERRRNRV